MLAHDSRPTQHQPKRTRSARTDRTRAVSGPKATAKPLDAASSAFLAERFSWNFGDVHVHAAPTPAYTQDAAMHLGEGFGRAGAAARQAMLAHEAAHVVQQSGGTRGERAAEVPVREAEREARAASEAAIGGRAMPALSPVATRAALGWDSFEHVAIGDAGRPKGRFIVLDAQRKDLPNYQRPPAEWSKPWRDLFDDPKTTFEQKRAMQQGLTYGEVLALSGDFYGGNGPAESTEALEAYKHLNAASFMEVVKLIPLIRSKDASTAQLETATGGRYLTLAKRNLAHFSRAGVDAKGKARNNLGVWKDAHTQALLAAQNGDADTARGMNAAADHFLTDAFSAGHTRQDREKLLDSPVKAKAIHDLDNEYGVDVANARGDHWTAYGDDSWDTKGNARNRDLALEAERSSQDEIEAAIAGGKSYTLPKAYAAEAIVPKPVDANKKRWGWWKEVKEYASLVVHEGPGIIAGAWTDDDAVRAWASSNPADAIARQPIEERIRMVDTLLSGIITSGDVDAIEKILSKSTDLDRFRARFGKELNHIRNLGYRTRVRIAMGF